MINTKDYLKRINYHGDLTPNLDVLRNLQRAHLLQIPFENLDIHWKIPIVLNLEKIASKVLTSNRGGFCYELNGLFFELLQQLGFTARRVSARVFDAKKEEYGQEYDHIAILVELNGNTYLSDVGFGEFSLNPLQLIPGQVQEDPRGSFVIESITDKQFRVDKLNGNTRQPEFIFSSDAQELGAFAGMCHYHQTNPDSIFTQKKLISIPTLTGRTTLTEKALIITEKDKIVQRQTLSTPEEFETYLNRYFSIEEPKAVG